MTAGGVTFERKITLGNIISVIGTLIAVFGIWWNFSGEFATAKSNIVDLQQQVAPIPAMDTRLTVVEVNQKNGADRGVQTQAALRDLQQQVQLVLQQQAAGNAKLEAISDAVKAKLP